MYLLFVVLLWQITSQKSKKGRVYLVIGCSPGWWRSHGNRNGCGSWSHCIHLQPCNQRHECCCRPHSQAGAPAQGMVPPTPGWVSHLSQSNLESPSQTFLVVCNFGDDKNPIKLTVKVITGNYVGRSSIEFMKEMK